MNLHGNIRSIIGTLIIMGVCIPLIMGKIPPNGLYGFRTAKSVSDPKIWYAINRYLGWALLLAESISLICYLALSYVPGLAFLHSDSQINFLIFLVPAVIAVVISILHLKKL